MTEWTPIALLLGMMSAMMWWKIKEWKNCYWSREQVSNEKNSTLNLDKG